MSFYERWKSRKKFNGADSKDGGSGNTVAANMINDSMISRNGSKWQRTGIRRRI